MKSAIPRYYHVDVEICPEKIDQVGRILAAHLRHWGLEILVEPVSHCTRVLLRAIEEHGTDKKTAIEMWWNGQHLITGVSDNDRDLPGPHYGPQGCLAQIAALSDGWGSCPATDGKIIWFSCRARTPEHIPLASLSPTPGEPTALHVPRAESVTVLAGSTRA
ncbi:pep a2 [Streptomyces sp. p1417]|uniref:Pep a2 n=1 Tax=Streptomyces typhae TaxID=2681492 RepID=A0A6L6X4K2_9ACTN|nr:pep a2 [Streptomyces typhae]MVO88691.1 pep a2 [Streptomyces typhae]